MSEDTMTNSADAVRLKRCPFCNAAGLQMERYTDDGKPFYVQCDGCGIEVAYAATREQSDEIWNRRAASEVQVDHIADERKIVPEGFALVPIEPTEDMVVNGFESWPDRYFSKPEDWLAFEAMSGCQQAAHRARLCYAAMLAASPAAPDHIGEVTEKASVSLDDATIDRVIEKWFADPREDVEDINERFRLRMRAAIEVALANQKDGR